MTKNNQLFGSNGGEAEVGFTDKLYDDIRTAVQILGKRAQSEEQVSKDQYMDLKDASESILNDAWEHIGGRPGGQFKIWYQQYFRAIRSHIFERQRS